MPKHYNTEFERLWGVRADAIAEEDHTTVSAIHMRVSRFGTPWQRKSKPTWCEAQYGRTLWELAQLIGVSTNSLMHRRKQGRDLFQPNCSNRPTEGAPDPQANSVFWLHPRHPDYQAQRDLFKPYENRVK